METESLLASGKIKLEPDCAGQVNEESETPHAIEKNVMRFTSLSYPEEDIFLYCEKCRLKYEGGCPEHGPFIYVDNAEVDQGDDSCLDFSPQAQVASKRDRQVFRRGDVVIDDPEDNSETLPNGGCVDSESDETSSAIEMSTGVCASAPSCGTQNNVENVANHFGKSFICDVCGAGFTDSGLLVAHKCTPTGEKPYKCDMCGVGFIQSVHLTTHKRIHTGEKPYICDLCGVGFAQSGHLITHKRTHTGEKPYKCDMCDDKFSQSGGLKIHMKTHTREKTYKCDVCGVGFARGGDLIQHKRTHTGEKPYKCDVCGVGFSQGGGLTRHYRIHTGEKPYKCDVCGVGCVRCGDLVRHKKTHTGEKPYKCDICGVGFSESGGLTRHKRIHK